MANKPRFGVAVLCLSALTFAHPRDEVRPTEPKTPPGTYATSWVGNTFGGDGGPNGFGYWVQNSADEIEVTPDGTVFAGLGWDEAGRCVGLYKGGRVNRKIVQAVGNGLPDSAWGWGTGNNALAVNRDQIFVANTGKKLLRFHWNPGDIESATFVSFVEMPGEAVGLTANAKNVAVVYKDAVELRAAGDLSVTGKFAVTDARDAVFAPDGSLWVLAGNEVRRFSAEGKEIGKPVPGLERPSVLSFDEKGRLIVCDDGPRQQVLFFDVSGEPGLVQTFGERGGLTSGIPGKVAPKKLFGLRGAGTDAQGNLYVACSFASGPSGNLFLRSFTPTGAPRWEVYSTAFVDTFDFDPASDGTTIYSRTAIFDLDLNRTKPGSEAKIRSVTLDPIRHPKDDRILYGCTTLVRRLQGRRLLYTIGQYAGGYRLYAFDEPNGDIAHPVDRIGGSEQWAWDVTENGDIWHGDAPGKTLRRYRFRGWTEAGKPDYDWKTPEYWPWPDGWEGIRRIHYDQATDTLYLSGYLSGQKIETWGVAGGTVRRYDNFLKGKPAVRWTADLPRDANTDPKEGPLTPSSVAFAGDYLFAGMVKPTNGKQCTHILRLSDGAHVGTFSPGPATGEAHGWLDMPYSTRAFRRKNGEYLILAEEDWRGKNLLYRWRP